MADTEGTEVTEVSETKNEGLIGGFLAPDLSGDTQHGQEHPEMSEEAADETEEEGDLSPAAPETEDAPVLFKGLNKSFKTTEELAAYASELERKQIEHEAKLGVFEKVTGKAPAEEKPAETKKSYAERLFTDPDGVLAEIEENAVKRVEAAKNKEAGEKSFWASFYEANPDLVGNEEIVDLKLNQNRQAWIKVPLTEAKVLLATEARKMIKKVRDSGKPTDVLPKGKAHSLGTGGSSPRLVTPEDAPKSFADQIKSLSKGKRTVR